jgi:hypothetical protein
MLLALRAFFKSKTRCAGRLGWGHSAVGQLGCGRRRAKNGPWPADGPEVAPVRDQVRMGPCGLVRRWKKTRPEGLGQSQTCADGGGDPNGPGTSASACGAQAQWYNQR